MHKVQAISFDEVDCGKSIAESKKRFKWKFRINGTTYLMELANSTLSGKRIVTLNSVQIHTEKSLLNIDFDFTHQIDGHNLRITRIPDNLTKFEMRIDNRTFDQILQRKHTKGQKEKQNSGKYYKNQSQDPFSDFGSAVDQEKNSSKPSKKNNDFGDFDLDQFSFSPNKHIPSLTQIPAQEPKQIFDFFDLKNCVDQSQGSNNFQQSGDLIGFTQKPVNENKKKQTTGKPINYNAKKIDLSESLI